MFQTKLLSNSPTSGSILLHPFVSNNQNYQFNPINCHRFNQGLKFVSIWVVKKVTPEQLMVIKSCLQPPSDLYLVHKRAALINFITCHLVGNIQWRIQNFEKGVSDSATPTLAMPSFCNNAESAEF